MWTIAVVVDNESWILPYSTRLVRCWKEEGHAVCFCRNHAEIPSGDVAFYLGCIHITPADVLKRNKRNLVVHESDLPRGKGFAPVAWQVLEGKKRIPIVLFEATEEIDSGPVYLRDEIQLQGHELMGEIRNLQGEKTISLCREFVKRYPTIDGLAQTGEASFYPRRRPEDSRLDSDKTLREQFSLLRVVDNERYPAFFEIGGYRYILRIEKASESGPLKTKRMRR